MIHCADLHLSLFRELPGVRGQRVRGAGGAGGGDAGGGHWSPAMFDQSLQVVMVPEHGVHPGATEVLPSLEMFDPSKYGLPAYDEEDSVLQDDDNSRDSIY